MIPKEFFDFDPPNPPCPFLEGGGVKTTLRIAAAVCEFGPRSGATFFLYMDPLTHGGSPGSQLQVPPGRPPLWALAVFTLEKAV